MKSNNNNSSSNNNNEERKCGQKYLMEQRICEGGAQIAFEGRAKLRRQTRKKKILMNEVILQIANMKGKLRRIFISAPRLLSHAEWVSRSSRSSESSGEGQP